VTIEPSGPFALCSISHKVKQNNGISLGLGDRVWWRGEHRFFLCLGGNFPLRDLDFFRFSLKGGICSGTQWTRGMEEVWREEGFSWRENGKIFLFKREWDMVWGGPAVTPRF